MNKCFLIGKIIEIEKFKFIISKKSTNKSQIVLKIKLIDGTIVNTIAYDEVADYILRNNFSLNKVYIQGRIENSSNNMQVNKKKKKKLNK